MNIQDSLTELLLNNGHGPFLFLGSGFSRRYIKMENWLELLRKFSANIKEFEYYFSSANSNLSLTASMMAKDYKEYWWKSDALKAEREYYKAEIINVTSPLKISISKYMESISSTPIDKSNKYFSEICELKNANIDGIITTNWDLLAEKLFPEYNVYIGQEELVVSSPQNIGEIYKIHGCCSKPNTLVLTSEDYQLFNERNPYLAAKLITIFVENPVIFIGYSLNDNNIQNLISSIIKGIGKSNIKKIKNNLIFVQRENEDLKKGYYENIMSIENCELPITQIVTSDFSEIYRPLQLLKRKIPTRILRHCKQQFFELIKSVNPSEKLAVIDINSLSTSSNIEFVVGVGINETLVGKGYKPISLIDIFMDIMLDDKNFDPESIIKITIPHYYKTADYIPVFKYLKQLNIDTKDKFIKSDFGKQYSNKIDLINLKRSQYSKTFNRDCKNYNISDIVSKFDSDKAALLIPHINFKKIDIKIFQKFILDNISKIDSKISNYSTYYRKLICIYDIIKYSWLVE